MIPNPWCAVLDSRAVLPRRLLRYSPSTIDRSVKNRETIILPRRRRALRDEAGIPETK
jgi:hypothetical protein